MIAVGGEALIDLVQRPHAAPIASPGGGPFNVARVIARLGADVRFCGTISRDHWGEQLIGALATDGVDLSSVLRSDLPTPIATAALDGRGNASYTFAFDHTAAAEYPPEARPALTGVAALHVGTLGLVFEPMSSTYRTMVAESPPDTMVVVDPNCRPMVIADRRRYLVGLEPVLARADVVKVSIDDLEYLAPDGDARSGARALLDRGARVVLLTSGAGGTAVFTRSATVAVPVVPVDVADTVGAGDALGGAFTAWWVLNGLHRDQLDDMAMLTRATEAASVVAALTCERVGADPPTRAELPSTWLDPVGPGMMADDDRA